ncbi:MAG TPA: hypothetical protein VGQ26_12435, partial [Streptosporangiaceae bacterium]|nr:hypothetical protein [Streptosporangiaceae bacterium]
MTSSLPMTPGRWVALVIGTPLVLLVIGWTALSAVAFAGLGSSRVNLAVPVHGRTAAVRVDEGDISVGPGPVGQLRVHGPPLLAGPPPAHLAALAVHDRAPRALPGADRGVLVRLRGHRPRGGQVGGLQRVGQPDRQQPGGH